MVGQDLPASRDIRALVVLVDGLDSLADLVGRATRAIQAYPAGLDTVADQATQDFLVIRV